MANALSNHIINISFQEKDTVLVIIKDQQILQIIEINDQNQDTIASFPLLPLPNLENKNAAQDNSIPEGIYFIKETITLEEYGNPPQITAAVLNYPNDADTYHHRTGNNVWIQNPTNDVSENPSCFYLKNENLNELMKYINLESTPILILKTLQEKFDNPSDYWEKLLQKWKETFGSKRLVSHFQMYITDSDQINFEYAKKINAIINSENKDYKFEIDNIIVLCTDHECVASFTFDFQSQNFSLQKQYSLSFLPVGSEWKIFSENASYTPGSRLNEKLRIKNMIFDWKKAWETKNFNDYISHYAKSYDDGSRNYRQYYNYRRRSLSSPGEIKIMISDLTITKKEDFWEVSFIQDYWTENFQDFGRKKLILNKIDDTILIFSETWEEIPRE
jgi:murein L,D-transpeptidase YafK